MNWFFGRLMKALVPLLLFICAGEGALPCALREVSKGKLVCVCNATYCDALDADAASVAAGRFKLFSSSKAGLRFQASEGALGEASAVRAGAIKFSVDPTSTYQTIIGFGGAFTDSAGINILSLSEPAQDKLLQSYFSPEGIEFDMGRVPIGGADFSTHAYSYDDDEENDTDLSGFKLADEDWLYKIPIIKRAKAMSRKTIKLLGAAWSPPKWMKTNNAFTGVSFLKEQFYQTWADYHAKFLRAYKDENLDFWGISTGNEPTNGIVVRFNSLGWTPKSQSKWVAENLGPVIKESDLNQTKILILDDQRISLPWWVDIMMQNKLTAKYTDGIAVHWYLDSYLPSSLLTLTHNHFPDKFIIATEACRGEKPWEIQKVILGSWSRAEDYMSDIIQDLNHWVSGWVDWNLALDLQGGPNWVKNFVDSAVIVNATADEFYKQPFFYAQGHFSKFIPEGSIRVSIQPETQKSITTTAFITPSGQTVVVVYNKGGTERAVVVENPQKGAATVSIPANSFNTLLF